MWLKDTWSTVKNKTKNKPYKCCCHRAALACLIADLELSTCVSVWVGEGRIDWAGKSKPPCSVYKWMEVELAKLSSLTYHYCITEHNNIAYNVQFKQIQAMQTHYTTLRHLASMMAAGCYRAFSPWAGLWTLDCPIKSLHAPCSLLYLRCELTQLVETV